MTPTISPSRGAQPFRVSIVLVALALLASTSCSAPDAAASAEAAQVSLAVTNGDHEPATKQVSVPAIFTGADHAGKYQMRGGETLMKQVVIQRLAVGRAQPQLKLLDSLPVQAALFQVVSGFRTLGGCQISLKVASRILIDLRDILLLVPPLPSR